MVAGLVLPAPQHIEPVDEEESMAPPPAVAAPRKAVPLQGKRKGWIPRQQADFGGGGAFPEVHVAQYPLDMGR